jgi:hypothetical protein
MTFEVAASKMNERHTIELRESLEKIALDTAAGMPPVFPNIAPAQPAMVPDPGMSVCTARFVDGLACPLPSAMRRHMGD